MQKIRRSKAQLLKFNQKYGKRVRTIKIKKPEESLNLSAKNFSSQGRNSIGHQPSAGRTLEIKDTESSSLTEITAENKKLEQ